MAPRVCPRWALAFLLLLAASGCSAFTCSAVRPGLARRCSAGRVPMAPPVQEPVRRKLTRAPTTAMGLPGFPGGGGGFSLFNVGTPELIVIGGLAWLLLGPKELLRLSREAGVLIGNLRQIGTEAAAQFRDAIESEIALDEIEQEKRAIEESMAQLRGGGKPAVKTNDMYANPVNLQEPQQPPERPAPSDGQQ